MKRKGKTVCTGAKMTNSRVKSIRIVGVITSYAFQRAKYFVLELHRSMPLRFPVPEIEGTLEMEWYEKVTEWRHIYGPEIWRLKRPVAVFWNEKFIGNDKDLLKLASLENVFVESMPMKNSCFMKKRFRADYLDRLKSTKLIYCYFDICIDDNFIGTLVFQLYSNVVPKTCENFTNLCLGNRGDFLSYKGSTIERIVKNGWLQGGDLKFEIGGGGLRMYPSPLEDECFGIIHDRRGVLSMVNNGRHMNGTQFLITLNPTPWLDTRYVAFGQLIQGANVLNALESIETRGEKPLKKIEIKNCGKLNLEDIDSVDLSYDPQGSDAASKKGPKKIETIAEQVCRLVMEAVTESLAVKENVSDIVHEGDTPSGLNLDLYFQGMYSLPKNVLEDTARYIRDLRRDLLRSLKPSATEIVEVITYDLVEAVFIKLVDLDDIREAASHPVYQKLISGINMEVEAADKLHVKKFVDQLVATCENMVKFISSKLNWMRRNSMKIRTFQEQMNDWIESFTLQETFADDNYQIVDRPEYVPPRKKHSRDFDGEEAPGKPDTEEEEDVDECDMKKSAKEKKIENITDPEICCNEKVSVTEPSLSNNFKSCIYELKRKKREMGDGISISDLIERSRYRLRIIRHQEYRLRSKARICLEKRIRKWMKEVVYTPETEWIRQTVFTGNDICIDHTEEIMYGAMTIGLLEMYYLMEEYMKIPKVKKYRTRTIYPEDETESSSDVTEKKGRKDKRDVQGESPCSSSENGSLAEVNTSEKGEFIAEKSTKWTEEPPGRKGRSHKSCTCGDICCDCTSEPGHDDGGTIPSSLSSYLEDRDKSDVSSASYLQNRGEFTVSTGGIMVPPTPPPSLDEEGIGSSCSQISDEFPVEDILARVTGESADNVNVKSFKWLQEYISNEGCELKSKFAAQVHSFLENEIFSTFGFLSKHSLVTKASLFSFSLSLANLLKDKNDLKSEIKDFIRDLWELYFNEMIKEALIEHPPEKVESAAEAEDKDKESGTQLVAEEMDAAGKMDASDKSSFKMNFDFDKFCKKHAELNSGGAGGEGTEEIADQRMKDESKEENEETEPNVAISNDPEINPEKMQMNETGIALAAEDDEILKIEIKEEPEPEAEKLILAKSKKRKSPIVIKELVESSIEVRENFPYSLPFWVKFLSEITKRTLGLIAKLSRLPRRLYFNSDSQISFDDKMKSWIEFNHFSSPTTCGRDIRDFIARHHVSVENLDATARSFLRKKIVSELIEKSSRSCSAMAIAQEMVFEIIVRALDMVAGTEDGEKKILEEVFEGFVGSATVSAAEIAESGDSDREDATATDVLETERPEAD